MNPDPRIRRFFRIPLRPDRVEREVEDELSFHLQEKTEALIDRGLEAVEARAEAERRFGDLGSVRQECRGIGRQRERRLQMRELTGSIAQDIRSIDVKQNILQRLFHLGNVYIATAATGEPEVSLEGITHPHDVKKTIIELKEQGL